ncbi:MAG: hypothetical protein KAH93_00525 [Candidatus Aenigmarchaeota archaeon]|nr:hypothetical protein [Candidatus Aenigmarchaeota archaeon]
MKKGQTIEILGFLVLVVVAIISMLALRLVTSDQKAEVMHIAQESHEEKYFNAGANTFIVITEPATNRTFVELIGLAGFFEKGVLEFGPVDDPITVDVFEELTERLDLIYGEGHWHLELPHAPRYQIYVIMVLDVSVSMKEEIEDIRHNIQYIIDEVEETTDRRVAFKLYFLPTGQYYRNMFHEMEKNNPCFRTYMVDCNVGSTNKNEAWARGMKCLIDEKLDDWGKVSAKVGIILSDEPPSGCEGCGCEHYEGIVTEACCPDRPSCTPPETTCTDKENAIDALIDRANAADAKMNIFTLKANPCNVPDRFRSQCRAGPIPYTCAGEEKLTEFMTTLSDGTGAGMYTVDNPKDVSKAIRDIVLSQPIPDVSFELGTTPPVDKRIHSYVIPAPTPIPGLYINAILKQWN